MGEQWHASLKVFTQQYSFSRLSKACSGILSRGHSTARLNFTVPHIKVQCLDLWKTIAFCDIHSRGPPLRSIFWLIQSLALLFPQLQWRRSLFAFLWIVKSDPTCKMGSMFQLLRMSTGRQVQEIICPNLHNNMWGIGQALVCKDAPYKVQCVVCVVIAQRVIDVGFKQWRFFDTPMVPWSQGSKIVRD